MAVPVCCPPFFPSVPRFWRAFFQGEETFSSPTPATSWGCGVPAHLLSGAVTPEAVGADCWGLWAMSAPHGWEWDPC